MYKNISIRKKLMIYVLGVSILMYVVSLGYVGYKFRQNAISEAQTLLSTYTNQKANEVKSEMMEDMSISRTMAVTILEYRNKPLEERQALQKAMMESVLERYPEYEAVWLSWELGAIEPNYYKDYGRERITYFYKDGKVTETVERVDLEGDNLAGDYYKYKTDKQDLISEPYVSEDYELGVKNTTLITSPCIPIMENGQFLGLIGADFNLDKYKQTVLDQKFKKGYAVLLSGSGQVVAHHNNDYVGNSVDSLHFGDSKKFDLQSLIANENSIPFRVDDPELGEEAFVSIVPIKMKNTINPWFVCSVVAVSEITEEFMTSFLLAATCGLIGLVVLILVLIRISNDIMSAITKSQNLLQNLALGRLDDDQIIGIDSKDELGAIAGSVNTLLLELNKKSEFAKQIRQGNLDTDFQISSEHDDLGQSLLKMRDNLKAVVEETNEVINKAGQEGQLDARIELEGKVGLWQKMSSSINNLLTSISTPLMTFNGMFNSLANGDLTPRYTDEAKGDVKKMTDNLNMALNNLDGLFNQIAQNVSVVDESSSEMQGASQEMSTNTREIASAIAQMSHGAQTQVAKVDESSNLIETILKTSNEMGDKAENINESAKMGVERSEKGMGMVNNVVDSIGQISNYSTRANDSIKILTERSTEIARVLGVITDIASQTNLLALNAAIEAAQAGDAGRGFAVVAEEIRKLAEDSRKSAKAIEQLVNDVQNDTQDAATSIGEMTSSVVVGQKTSIEAADVFKEIYDASTETLSVSEEIVNATKMQTTSVNDVVTIIEGVVVIAEQTAAGTEEVASSATELSAGMGTYSDKTGRLAEIAESLKEGMSMVKFSGASSENTAIFQMKEAFEKEKYLLDALLSYMPDTIYFKDKDSKFIRNSMSHAKQFGVSDPAELVGKSDFDFFGEHAQKARDQELRIMESAVPDIGVIERNDLKDGTINYASSTKLPLYDLEGSIVGTFGITRDVTDTKLAEVDALSQVEAFEKEKSLLDALLTTMPDAIYFKDLKSKFIRCSTSVAQLVGHENGDELIGKSDFDFYPEDAQEWFEEEQKIITSGEGVENDVSKNILPDGRVIYASNTKKPLKDIRGNVIGTFGISRDITDLQMNLEKLKELEAENKELQEQLNS